MIYLLAFFIGYFILGTIATSLITHGIMNRERRTYGLAQRGLRQSIKEAFTQ